MDKAFEQIRDMARTAGEADRRKLLDGVRDLAYSLESPKDTTDRIMFLVRLYKPPHQLLEELLNLTIFCVVNPRRSHQGIRTNRARIIVLF